LINLKGEQDGTIELDLSTGMLLNSSIETHVKGTINMLNREMPVKVTPKQKVAGKHIY
jgi:hypothetical protein